MLLVLIGDEWAHMTGEDGRRRLEDPHDFVRLEVASALARGVTVVPVLVEGATMPATDDLPEDLQPLARRNAIDLSDARWHYDMSRLIQAISHLTGEEPGGGRGRRPVLLAGVGAGLLALVIGGVLLLAGGGDDPAPPRNVTHVTPASTGPAAPQVRQVLTTWFTDVKASNCDLVTDRWLQNYDGQTREAQLRACRDYLGDKGSSAGTARIDDLEVEGDAAQARVRVGGLTYTAYLKRQGGRWLLDDTDD